MRIFRSAPLLFATSLIGCAHTQLPASPEPKPANIEHSSQPLATNPPAAESAEEENGEPVAPQPAQADAAKTQPIESYMFEHFLIATLARDSIIDGNLAAIRTPLHALAVYGYDNVTPGAWTDGIKELQQAARVASESQTLEAAAGGVATMARICGQCHLAQGGPKPPQYKHPIKKQKSDDLDARMVRHAWAADRLWEGLIAPSDSAWQAGASALTRAPAATPKAAPSLSNAGAQALLHVRELGQRATAAKAPQEREQIYGELLATCASCHEASDAAAQAALP